MKMMLFVLLLFSSFSIDARPNLLEQLGFSRSEPLPVDKAFVFSSELIDAQTIGLSWRVADGNYLYRDNFQFDILDNAAVQITAIELPEGENTHDEFFGLTEIYPFDVHARLTLDRPVTAQSFELQVVYQGCSQTFSICYPPERKTVTFNLPALDQQTRSTVQTDTLVADRFPTSLNQQDRIAQTLNEGTFIKIIASFFGLGLLLSFTPCVFPMIPILSSIIVGEGEKVSSRRAFLLSLVFVLAMSVTYTAAGVLTGLMGGNLQAFLQNIWVLGFFSLILVALALSMFGFYQLQLPLALQNRVHQVSQQHRGGKFYSVAIMGLLSGLIVGPCLAPPLAGALLFISQQADAVLGGIALFSLSLGMGIPLLIIGTSAGALLPKAGAWMNNIKAVFGVLLLALAIWMLDRVLPGWVTLLLSGSLLIVSGVYMGALNVLGIDANGWQKFWKGTGLIVLFSGFLLLIGAASGGQSLWQPLKHLTLPHDPAAETASLNFIRVDSLAELEQQLAQTSRPVMLDFYADWCTDCKTMEQTTFTDPQVVRLLENFVLLKVDMTDNTAEHQAILRELRVFGPPTFIFYGADGTEYAQQRLIGHISATRMQQHLTATLNLGR